MEDRVSSRIEEMATFIDQNSGRVANNYNSEEKDTGNDHRNGEQNGGERNKDSNASSPSPVAYPHISLNRNSLSSSSHVVISPQLGSLSSPVTSTWNIPPSPPPLSEVSVPRTGWETVWERFAAVTDDPQRLQLLQEWVSLPTIAVLGDTSCGKSSLLSQLSGIMELPSSHEITTKCPTELKMRFATQRLAKINICWKNGASRNSQLSERLWQERVLQTDREWNEIPDILRKAQQLILSQQQQLVRGSNSNKQVQFTVASDVISIELEGPMYPPQQTLTLVDLPGLVQIHNALTESPTVSSEIEQVVLPYLKNKHCLLVTVLPANVDYHNAHALKLAAQYDPQGNRTCIVWTKPDLIDQGAESGVAEWLQQAPRVLNCRHVHMIKCRGQAALTGKNDPTCAEDNTKVSLATALDTEEDFFAHTAPWKDMDPSLFGTANLRKKLSLLQARLVQNSLPSILGDLQSQLIQTQNQLQSMGGKPLGTAAERRHYYQSTCQRLLQHLQTSLSGKGSGGGSKIAFSSLTGGGGSGTAFSSTVKLVPPPPPPASTPPLSVASRLESGSSLTAGSLATAPTLAANRLHEACSIFTNQIKHGSLATIRSVCEGAHVIVASSRGTVRGEVVHLDEDEGYCCVDMYAEDSKQSAAAKDILFEFTGQPFTDGETAIDENDVWSDEIGRVCIARSGGVYDALRKIPLDCVWTDPAMWLQSHMAQFRTDDLACFLNVESFAHIVQEFMQEDWKPACQQLLASMKSILQQALSQALEYALSSTCSGSNAPSFLWQDGAPRYPGLRQLLQRQMRQVADSMVQEAQLQVESHLAMEAHPFTQDEALFARMNRARYSRLKRELEVALLAELQSHPKPVGTRTSNPIISHNNHPMIIGGNTVIRPPTALSTGNHADAVQTILDQVFDRHEKMPVQEHLAFEMELVLESYGEIATRRVLDRTPMICWQVFRSYCNVLSASLMSTVTDHDLTAAMAERSEFAQEYQLLSKKCEKLLESIQVLESLL